MTARNGKHFHLGRLLVGGLLVLLALQGCARSVDANAIVVTLHPSAPDAQERIESIQVSVRLPISTQAAGQAVARVPLVISNVKTSAAAIRDVKAHDAKGPVALTHRDDDGEGKSYRHWVASRPVHGPLTITYRVPITNQPNPLGAAPPYELRSAGSTFSGLIGTFVTLPERDKRTYRLALHWDFSALPGKSSGVSTLGVGNAISAAAKDAEDLQMIFVMGGHPMHEPDRPGTDGFFSAWQGNPPFDARELLQWTHRLYGNYMDFFGTKKPTYTIYLRPNPVNPGGGVEVGNSFVGTFGPQTQADTFKLTLAHEMVHTFVGGLDADKPLTASWFSEGLAVYYERLLPWRAGMISTKAYLKDLNTTAARYYTDKLKTTPNSGVSDRFWADTRVRVLPYDRGALYFSRLNARIRKVSHGKRSLDDVLLAFLHRRAEGKPLTRQAWVEAVVRAVGPSGKQAFEDMLAGKPVILASDAFGPCFRRVSVPLRRYQLGFTPDVLIEPTRIVRGLIPDSAAARAGLRNGDEILEPVAQDAVQADQHATLTLHIRRGDKVMDITYLPRGKTVPTYQWVRTGETDCRAR